MNSWSFSAMFGNWDLATSRRLKRTPSIRGGWGIETEMLEDRALLSAAAKCGAPSDAQFATAGKAVGKAVEIPNVGGNFSVQLTASNTPFGDIDVTDDSVDLTQNGKKLSGSFDAEGATASFRAKLRGTSSTEALVKATVNISGQTFKAKFAVTYDSTDHFSGQATIKKLGSIVVHIEGTRN
jgi:hypothetical protein